MKAEDLHEKSLNCLALEPSKYSLPPRLIDVVDVTKGLHCKICLEGSNGVHTLSFDMLTDLRRASVLVFPKRRTQNPKTQNAENSKSWIRKYAYAVRQHDILNVAVWEN